MEFRVLGPLEVVDRGRTLPLRGEKQRALLAALLIRANQAVAEDVLLEELWAGARPASGKAALRVRVSQLRRTLGDGGNRLVTRAPGYALELNDDELDAGRFERLLLRGRQAARSGDPAAAAATLRSALDLWRGSPLADLSYEPFAQTEIARLAELRLAAVEELMEAELALGRHAAVTGELEALVAEHPLRERLRGQLMTALYRSGRQAEALAVYRGGREALVEGLGIEPGAALQELERAILRQDGRLDLPGSPRLPGVAIARDERKLVTILAARLAGNEPADPERARARLDELRAIVEAEAGAADGRIEAVVGDTVTAAFGVPASREDHAECALGAALAIRKRTGRGVRIGVDSGEAVYAEGSNGAAVVGPAVSNAARLAQDAGPGDVLVGGRAAEASRAAYELGASRADGSCLLLPGAVATPRAAPGAVELVGRRRELAALTSGYRAAVSAHRPHLLTVAGDAGVGKSRLVRELDSALEREELLPRLHTARCLPHGRGVAYRPLAELLRAELGPAGGETPESALARAGADPILGVTLGLDAPPDVHPLEVRDRLAEAWTTLFARLAGERPLVVVFEDLHWAQDALLDLVERLHTDVRGPALLVGTARPELFADRPAWGRHADATTLWLEPLPREDAERLLELVTCEAEELPPTRRSEVLDRAEGNPFFLEELARAAPTARAIPDSVHAVLAGRIDLLPAREKEALQAAAVIGRAFRRQAVEALVSGESPDLELLEARDFIRRRPGSASEDGPELAFKHALTWEVAYGTLTTPGRAGLHAAYADWLERTSGGRSEHAALLAHHYAEAVRPEDADLAWHRTDEDAATLRAAAVRWLRRAAELATGRYELADALSMLRRALDFGPDRAAQLDLWRAIGRAHALRHDGDSFLEAMMKAIALSTDETTTATLYAHLSLETALRTGMWRTRPERELVDGWIDRALELAEPDSATRARALIARCVWAPYGSAEAAREASRIAEALGNPELRSYAWDARGITAWVAGEPDLGRAFEERRFELLDQIHDPDHRADIYYAPVTGCVWLGHFGEARRLAAKHDEIVSALTPHHRIHGVAVLAEVEELAGDWDAIRGLRHRVETVVLPNRETPCMRSPRILLVSALAELHLGDADRAAELEELADSFGVEGFGHTIETPRLRIALVRGDLETAEDLVAKPLPDRGWHRAWLLLSTQAARLDALGAFRRADDLERWPRAPSGHVPGAVLPPRARHRAGGRSGARGGSRRLRGASGSRGTPKRRGR